MADQTCARAWQEVADAWHAREGDRLGLCSRGRKRAEPTTGEQGYPSEVCERRCRGSAPCYDSPDRSTGRSGLSVHGSGGNDGKAVKAILPWISNHYIGTAFQAFLDANGDQAIAYYTIFKTNADGTDFDQIGSFDGQTNTVTLNEQ